VNRRPIARTKALPRGVECPEDVDWNEVAAGHWPELKATQLMMRAALCEHCGPLLRAAKGRNMVSRSSERSAARIFYCPTLP